MAKEKRNTGKPFYKKIWFWIIVIIFFAAVASGRNKETDNSSEDNTSVISSSEPSVAPTDESETIPEETLASDSGNPDESEAVPEETSASDSGDSLADVDITFYDEFRNDVTGKWRKALALTNSQIQDYAVDYYNTYFQSDDEVHIIYNFSLNTVNCLKVFGNELFISITDYVDDEEHDAKIACSGTFLGEYHINIDTGEITYNSFDE